MDRGKSRTMTLRAERARALRNRPREMQRSRPNPADHDLTATPGSSTPAADLAQAEPEFRHFSWMLMDYTHGISNVAQSVEILPASVRWTAHDLSMV